MTILFGESSSGKLHKFDLKAIALELLEVEQNWFDARVTSWLEVVSSTYDWLQEISLKAKGSRRSVIIKEICTNIKTFKRRKQFEKFNKRYPRTPISRAKATNSEIKAPSYFLTTNLKSVSESRKPQQRSKTSPVSTTTTEQVYNMLKSEAFVSFYDNAFFSHVEGEKRAKGKKSILKDLALLLETA